MSSPKHGSSRAALITRVVAVLALYVLAFAGFAVLGFLIRRWPSLVLPPIIWSLLFIGPDLGWWGDDSSETAWTLLLPFSILSMLTMTVGILLGRNHAARGNRTPQQT